MDGSRGERRGWLREHSTLAATLRAGDPATRSWNPVPTATRLLPPFLLRLLSSQGEQRFLFVDSWGIPDSLRPACDPQVNLSPEGEGLSQSGAS